MGSSGRTLKNTAELVEEFDNVVLQDEMLVSYDVKSLFMSIPVAESIDTFERRLRDDDSLADRTGMDASTVFALLKFGLTSTSFQYEETHYKQLDGVAMGSPVSPVIADIFMENFEDRTFATKPGSRSTPCLEEICRRRH